MTQGGGRVGRPSNAEAAQIEARILAAAWAVLHERGLENFTIDQVALLAQASKRTIYARFPNRTALYRRMIADRTAAFVDSICAIDGGGDLARMLEAQAIGIVQFIRSPDGRALAQLEERVPCGGEAPLRRSIHQRAIIAATETLRRAGPADALPESEIAEAATFWVASLIGYGRMIGGDPAMIADDAAWARRHTELFLRAVRPDKRDGAT
jgi:AcrR family transcriptional regulator